MPSGTSVDETFEAMAESLKKAVAAFESNDVPYLLGGGLAAWARGGSESYKDLDFMVKPADAERALEALRETGMRPERPPEQWLLKAWDGDVLIDLIFHPQGMEITDEVIERGDEISLSGIDVQVMALEDVLATKLLAIGEHSLDYEKVLQMARSLREQINWDELRARTSESPYASAFFTLVESLGIAPPAGEHQPQEPPADPPSGARVKAV